MYIWSKVQGKGHKYLALKITNSDYDLFNDIEKSKINILKEFSDCKVITVSKEFYYELVKKYDLGLPHQWKFVNKFYS